MSVISNLHTATVYESKGANKSVAQFGQRLVVTIAKGSKSPNGEVDKNGKPVLIYGAHLQQTMATSIPQLTKADIDFNNPKVQEACLDYFKGIQNLIVGDNLREGKKATSTEELGQDGILNYLTETEGASGEKWTKEKIVEWFTGNLAEFVGVALLEKGMAEDKLESSLNAYAKLISETLSSKAVIPTKKAEAIKKALDFGDQTDSAMIKFQARIEKSLKVVDMDELLGL